MIARTLLIAFALLAASAPIASAQSTLERADAIASPRLRANVTVTGDIVRVGDLIDNAGSAAQIAMYRAPDLGTTGVLPTAHFADRPTLALGKPDAPLGPDSLRTRWRQAEQLWSNWISERPRSRHR